MEEEMACLRQSTDLSLVSFFMPAASFPKILPFLFLFAITSTQSFEFSCDHHLLHIHTIHSHYRQSLLPL